MNIESLAKELNTNTYPGRGIVLGKSKDGKKAVIAYFIMGRSVNSRNRIFEENDRGGIRTKAFDESKTRVLLSTILFLNLRTKQLLQTATKQTQSMIALQTASATFTHFALVSLSLTHRTILQEFRVLLSQTATIICQSSNQTTASRSA